jgi:formiminotetrahydrofolate cyclodeaminase
MAASLVCMVSKIVSRKENVTDLAAKLEATTRRSEELRKLFAGLVEADATAFGPVAAA